MTRVFSRQEPISSVVEAPGELRGLKLIESVGAVEPFRIVPISQCSGTAVGADEVMATKVKWARKAGYTIVTMNVPSTFAPYNAIIRISESGTEDQNRDYLAEIVI